MPRTKGSRNGYTKYPGKYTPVGKRATGGLKWDKPDYEKIWNESGIEDTFKKAHDDYEKHRDAAVESGRLSYDDLHPTSKVKYPDTNTHSFTDYHNTKGYKTGKKNDWQQKANKVSSFGHNIYSKRKYIRNVNTSDSNRYVKKKEEALNARRRELRANTQKAAAASRLRNAHSDIGNALRDARDDLRSLFRRVSRKLKRRR